MYKLEEFVFIYRNPKESINEIFKRHPFSIVVYIKIFPNNDNTLISFLNEFKEHSMDYHKTLNTFKYKRFLKTLIIRHPIKTTLNLDKINKIEVSLRNTYKIIDSILDFKDHKKKELLFSKYYIKNKEDLDKSSLLEKDIALSENKKKKLEKKRDENYDPDSNIKYATDNDISKLRFNIGDAEFRYRIKNNIYLFHEQSNIHYDNDYLYEKYVKPYERGKKGDKKGK